MLPLECGAETPEKRANQLYREGKKKTTDGDLAAAERLFTEAWSVFEHPLIMKKRAEVRERRSEIEGALEDYRAYFLLLRRGARTERRLILERIATLESLLVIPVEVTVIASQTGAQVSIDGAPARPTPFKLRIVPGEHVLVVKDSRYRKQRVTFKVAPAKPGFARVAVVLKRAPTTLGSDAPSLSGMQLVLDDEPITITAREASSDKLVRALEPGSHRLECRNQEGLELTVDFRVTLAGDNTALCNFASLAPDRVSDPWGWVTVGLGAAALGTGVGYLVSWSADRELAAARNQRLKSSKHIAGGVLVGAGVALAAGSYFVFMRDRRSGQARMKHSIVPVASIDEGGRYTFGAAGHF